MSVFVYKLGHDNCVLGEANYLNGANHEATQIRDKNLFLINSFDHNKCYLPLANI